ncbi:hypothetical protein [Nocardia sp. alder85J]|uniref:hypothetical protein n=1 Tax=Nocardia sp. alder85J TaxID=2862949 RepID=UPI001CD78EB9|nr:hypothetical protein [Nocardia sp. alder85J]MCX4094463.1 hypothetical protein [Nocardia sp. alder85J]
MERVPPSVAQHELDLLWQSIFTWASWAIVAIMLAAAIRLGIRQRTPFYLFACLAAGVAAFAEPLYDVAFDLWFYDVHDGRSGAMYSHFTAFGVVQPNWTHSGYIILYASACLYAGRAMYEGRWTRRGLFAVWAAEIAASCVFEIIGTGFDVYTYYGPYVLRIWHYPLVIGILEGTQVVLFTVLAVHIRRRAATWWGAAGLFIAFPLTMVGTNAGIGFPLVIALHLDRPQSSAPIVWVATLSTMALCVVAVSGASRFLPTRSGRNESGSPGVDAVLAGSVS